MTVFGDYASYYDLLYKDKDYQGEADYIYSLIKRFAPVSSTVLELGCGTAKHALLLAKKGLDIHGVDMSAEMLEQAKKQVAKASKDAIGRVSLSQGDVRTFRLDKKFDVVISLFHVMSYQTTNEDLQAAFATAAAHLNPGGVFIFDYWYGPSVLTQRPEVRVKRLENDKIKVIRIAEPTLSHDENCVTVDYSVWILDKDGTSIKELHEAHKMRYLFLPEIASICQPQFQVAEHLGWEKQTAPTMNDWASVSVLTRN